MASNDLFLRYRLERQALGHHPVLLGTRSTGASRVPRRAEHTQAAMASAGSKGLPD